MGKITLESTDFAGLRALGDQWLAYDCETWLIAPGRAAPPLVCGSWAGPQAGTEPRLTLKHDTLARLERALQSHCVLLGHNVVYDMAVAIQNMPRLLLPVFRAFEQGRILDTMVIEKLRKIAHGWTKFDPRSGKRPAFTLAYLVSEYLGEQMAGKIGNDVWRLRYQELDGVPLDKWSEGAATYALDDASYTARVFERQIEAARSDAVFAATLVDLRRQMMAAFGLQMMSIWGFRTDAMSLALLETDLHEHVDHAVTELEQVGIYERKGVRVKKPPSRNMARIRQLVQQCYDERGEAAPMTEGGKGEVKNPKVKTDNETLLLTQHPDLVKLADIGGDQKLLSTYVPILRRGIRWPINVGYNVLVDTGRTSCVAAGTLIQVVRDVSKHPKGLPIEQVRAGDLAYCYDDQGKLRLRKVLWAGKTGHRKVLRLHWQGSGHHTTGFVDLTPEHLVRTTSRGWVRADALLPADRVYALSRGVSNGYGRLWPTGAEEISREHRFIVAEICGAVSAHVHHKNGNKLDNRTENLELMSASEHTSLHTREALTPERRARISEHFRRLWQEQGEELKEKLPRGEDHRLYLGLTREWLLQELHKHKGKPVALAQEHGIDYATLQKYMKQNNIRFQDIAAQYNERGEFIDAAFVERVRAATALPGTTAEKTKRAGMSYYRWAAVQKQFGYTLIHNHEIWRIEQREKEVDVYDLTVEDCHNFIANEICVHNCFAPNIQNQPRRGGVRECFVPRKGYLYVGCDYHTAEMRSLAQVCLDKFGYSEMAEALKQTPEYPHGKDLHLDMAAHILGITYAEAAERLKSKDETVKDARQLSKAANFGLPGGLGAAKFQEYAWKTYRVRIEEKEAKRLKAQWMGRYPEMKQYFAETSAMTAGGLATLKHHRSGRLRGGVGYTDGNNSYFQGLTADGAKLAVWAVVKESWTGWRWDEEIPADATGPGQSPLLGFRPTGFIHDEILGEAPRAHFRRIAKRLAETMCEAMRWFVPDVPVLADAHAMYRWFKDAEPVYDKDGNLVPWEPTSPQAYLRKHKDAPQELLDADDLGPHLDKLYQLDQHLPPAKRTNWKSVHRMWYLNKQSKEAG